MEYFDNAHQIVKSKEKTVIITYDDVLEPLPMHTHPVDQFLYVNKGIAYLLTDENQYYIPANHFIWIPADMRHSLNFTSEKMPLLKIYYKPVAGSDNFYRTVGIYPLNNLLYSMLQFAKGWDSKFTSKEWQYRFLETFRDLFSRINRESTLLYLPTTDNERLMPVLDYLKSNLDTDLSIHSLTERFGFSVRSFSRFFSNEMKIPYVQYLKCQRIISAVELFIREDVSVSEVAYRVGYSSLTIFSNNFKQITGKRPKEFKMNLLKNDFEEEYLNH